MEAPPHWGGEAIGPFVRLREDRIYLMDFGVTPTDEEFDEHFEKFGRWCDENRDPIGGVVLLRRLLSGTAQQRKRVAEFEKRVQEHDREHITLCAIVAPNTLTRGLVTAVFWLAPPVYPHAIFSDLQPALDAVVAKTAAALSSAG